jgi:hypothetical protein
MTAGQRAAHGIRVFTYELDAQHASRVKGVREWVKGGSRAPVSAFRRSLRSFDRDQRELAHVLRDCS